mgnify:CR=1 FL=1
MSRSRVTVSKSGLDPKRVERARRRIVSQGLNMSDWARRHGFDIKLVHAVLEGKRKCLRGKSHRIAILLDLKDGELPDIDQLVGGSPSGNADNA